MRDFLKWCSENSTAISAVGGILAAIGGLVAATAAVVYTRMTGRLIQETEAARLSRYEPSIYVTYEFDVQERNNNLVIANYGSGLAKNIRLTCESTVMLADSLPLKESSFFANAIPSLAPNAKIITLFNMGSIANKNPKLFKIEAVFEDVFNKSYHTESVIDIKAFDSIIYTLTDNEMYKRKSADALESMVKLFERAERRKLSPKAKPNLKRK